jgi:enolase
MSCGSSNARYRNPSRSHSRAICSKTDGTELKEKVGGNAVTAASFALAEAGAFLSGEPLYKYLAGVFHRGRDAPKKFSMPTPMVNILNGGKHAGGNLKIQEFMIMPNAEMSFAEVCASFSFSFRFIL